METVSSCSSSSMSALERKTGLNLAAIFSLRMFGLFLILPVFSVYAQHLSSGNNQTLVGLAIGIYGLTQACLQLAYGSWSDRFGRKPVIIAGLLIFCLGSIVAASATSIYTVIIGRAIQGAGAISAAVTALAADLTPEAHRTKVMAMIGSSIGLAFALSMVLAPIFYAYIGMNGIFWLTAVLSLISIYVVWKVIPSAPRCVERRQGNLIDVFRHPELRKLNLGVFILYLIQMTMWVLIPSALVQGGHIPLAQHWKVYLPTILISFLFMVPAIILAEKHKKMKLVFNGGIVLLILTQVLLYFFSNSLLGLSVVLVVLFIALNILEAIQPSWISKIVHSSFRGTALGVYNTLQSIGLFMGGFLGGFIAHQYGNGGVTMLCLLLGLLWFIVSLTIRPPQ